MLKSHNVLELQDNTFHAQQISGRSSDFSYILSLIVKRTYRISENATCILSDDQVPITRQIKSYEDAPKLISTDTDLYPFKYFTDIVIKGRVSSVRRSSRFLASLEIAGNTISFLVIGNRKAYLNSTGEIKFTEAELIEEVPLRYDYAYGGKDTTAEQKIQLPDPEQTKYLSSDIDLLQDSPYRYRRNPMGKGFLVEPNKESIEILGLPNLEDPKNFLTPENIVVKDPSKWYKLPLPRCTDWFNPLWFPRIAYFGLWNIENKVELPEVQKKWADANILSIRPNVGLFNLRATNGASLGLQLPYIKPGEVIRLTNMHPKFKDFVFQLPTEHPDIWVDGRKGKLLPTKPVIHTVVIEPDENRVSIVWRGCGPALRPYHEEELKTMPFKVEWRQK